MSMDRDFERLRALYGGMGDGELMGLAAKKSELTELAQGAVDAEMKARGLELAVEDLPEVSAGEVEGEAGEWEELMLFQVPSDAETAFRSLEASEIPAKLEYAMRQLVEDGPVVKTNWLSVFIAAGRREEAVRVLRREMGLFPEAEVDHREGEEEEALLTVGSFDVEADAEVA